jgi:hypothetical protein
MAAEDAGTSLEAAVAMKNFSFYAGSDSSKSVLQVFKMSSWMTSVVIDGVTKAAVEDFGQGPSSVWPSTVLFD